MDKLSYSLGLGIGDQLRQLGEEQIVTADFTAAIEDVIKGNELKVSHSEAQAIVNDFFQKVHEEKVKVVKEAGEKFLAENAKKEGVVVTKSGLQYLVIREGNGKQPKATDTVLCHYEGTLSDGTIFDSSYKRGEPASFGLQQVIAGWTEGLQLMKEGAKYRFFIPYMLGYGAGGAGASIPPYAALVFDVELLEVK